jgi:HKD family nuclease
LSGVLESALADKAFSVAGIASAFVSSGGVAAATAILGLQGQVECRLVTTTALAVTDPNALELARNQGWSIRISQQPIGFFHPKLIVVGRSFDRRGSPSRPTMGYVGSANLTMGGLRDNTECGLVTAGPLAEEAAAAFGDIWSTSKTLTRSELDAYAERFAAVNRERSVPDLLSLGVSDRHFNPRNVMPIARGMDRSTNETVRPTLARSAWAELRSFTGEYTFQVEFPKAVAEILARLVSAKRAPGTRVSILFEDGSTRSITARYYEDNSMYRLNVPGDIPNAAWARKNRSGIALVESVGRGGKQLRLRILRPGSHMDDVVGRSLALGTWGRTSTRIYGWY